MALLVMQAVLGLMVKHANRSKIVYKKGRSMRPFFNSNNLKYYNPLQHCATDFIFCVIDYTMCHHELKDTLESSSQKNIPCWHLTCYFLR